MYQAETEEYEAKYQAKTGDNFGDCHQAKTKATAEAKTKEYKAKYQADGDKNLCLMYQATT